MGTVTVTDLHGRQIREQRLKGCGYKAIAAEVGLSSDVVRNFCRTHDLDGYADARATDEQAHQGSPCPNCGKYLTQPHTGRKRKFCSDICRRSWWSAHPASLQKGDDSLYKLVCIGCGQLFFSYGNRNRLYCNHDCYIHNRFKK